jgi:hypothetical protein
MPISPNRNVRSNISGAAIDSLALGATLLLESLQAEMKAKSRAYVVFRGAGFNLQAVLPSP